MIRICNVSHAIHGMPVLQDVSLSLDLGQRMAIAAPDAAGRRAISALIAGTLQPGHGVREISGMLICAQRLAREMVAPFTMAENIRLYARLMRVDPDIYAASVIDLARLSQHLHEPVARLNPAERQQLALAMAASLRPDCIAFDAKLPKGFAAFMECFLQDRMPHKSQIRFYATPKNIPPAFDQYLILVDSRLISCATPQEIQDVHELANAKERLTNADC